MEYNSLSYNKYLNVGATLTLTSNPTYYAITKKVVAMTYTKDSTVSAVGATSGTCTISGILRQHAQ
ncbi:MAG: hypothetical protein V8R01_05805 [Bacilli bacterium]